MSAEARAAEDYISRLNFDGVTEIRPCIDLIGDSLTAGYGASPNEHWGRRMCRDLDTLGWHLQAVSGFTLEQMAAMNKGKRLLTIRERRTRHLFSLWGGTNNIVAAGTAVATFATLTATINELLTAGYIGGVVPTMLPRVDCTAGEETYRLAYNALILGLDATYPGQVYSVDLSDDVGLATIDGTAGYWHADDIHLLDPGYQAVADLVAPIVTALLAA